MRVSVIGSGPNGLAAAVIMARSGYDVCVYEERAHVGGGVRTAEFAGERGLFDIGSAVHPMGVSSRFFRDFGLDKRVQFAFPQISYAHALDGESAVAYRDLARTVDELGRDGPAWGRAIGSLVHRIAQVRALSGLTPEASFAQLVSALELGAAAGVKFTTLRGKARALASGATAHGAAPMSSLSGRFVGAVLAAEAHAAGWPIPIGGSQAITQALVADLEHHGGKLVKNHEVTDVREVWQPGDITFFDTSPSSLARIAGDHLPTRYRRALGRYRYGNAASKVDFVLDAPIPWVDERLAEAGTVHLGGPASVVSRAEIQAKRGVTPDAPFILLSQPTRFDRSRLPAGSTGEIAWTYAHVPNDSPLDATELITRRIERFAPGFRDVIAHSEARPARWFAQENQNFVGGDILGGSVEFRQFLTRPVSSISPWRTPVRGIYICSAATPPGAGVHGMGGWHAARAALRDHRREPIPSLAPTSLEF